MGGISLWFWFAFPWRLMMLNVFLSAHWPFVYVVWRNVFSDPSLILKWVIYLFRVSSVFMCSRYKCLISYVIFKYFLPFCGLSFHFLWCPLKHKSFKFWWNLVYLFIYCLLLVFLVSYLRNHCQIQGQEALPYVSF